jgi:hypothetical protein
MALYLNLYHEVARRKRAERRDPLKISLMAAGLFAAVMMGYYFWELDRVTKYGLVADRKRAEVGRLQSRAMQGVKLDAEFTQKARLSAALVERMEERFYWAPLLEQLARATPLELQVTRLTGEVTGEERRCVLNLEGVAGGVNPRATAEALRAELKGGLGMLYRSVQSDFRSLEDAPESFSADGRHFATFHIQAQFIAGKEPQRPAPQRVKRTKP